jgi:hypothetical protein
LGAGRKASSSIAQTILSSMNLNREQQAGCPTYIQKGKRLGASKTKRKTRHDKIVRRKTRNVPTIELHSIDDLNPWLRYCFTVWLWVLLVFAKQGAHRIWE